MAQGRIYMQPADAPVQDWTLGGKEVTPSSYRLVASGDAPKYNAAYSAAHANVPAECVAFRCGGCVGNDDKPRLEWVSRAAGSPDPVRCRFCGAFNLVPAFVGGIAQRAPKPDAALMAEVAALEATPAPEPIPGAPTPGQTIHELLGAK